MTLAPGTWLAMKELYNPCYPARRRVAPGEEYIVEPEDVVVDPLHEIGNATILRTQYLSARNTNALLEQAGSSPWPVPDAQK